MEHKLIQDLVPNPKILKPRKFQKIILVLIKLTTAKISFIWRIAQKVVLKKKFFTVAYLENESVKCSLESSFIESNKSRSNSHRWHQGKKKIFFLREAEVFFPVLVHHFDILLFTSLPTILEKTSNRN